MIEKYIPSYMRDKPAKTPGENDATKALQAELATFAGGSSQPASDADAPAPRGTPGVGRAQVEDLTLKEKILGFFGFA
ncbi:MAG: hypothetical protein ACI9WU_003310 [Myxococcota bacterium]|jgi:hypothetical protein